MAGNNFFHSHIGISESRIFLPTGSITGLIKTFKDFNTFAGTTL